MLGGASSSARTSMTVPCRPMAPSSLATHSRSMAKAPAARAARKSRNPKAAVTLAPAAASSSARYCRGAQPMPPPTRSALVTPCVGNALPSGPARSTVSPTSSPASLSLPAPRASTSNPARSPCTPNNESGRRSKKPPPGTVTMTNWPGDALAVTPGATSSSAVNAPKRRTAETRQWEVSAHCPLCAWSSVALAVTAPPSPCAGTLSAGPAQGDGGAVTAKATDDHAHSGQWAETSHCRVSAVRRFGAFTALELVAPGVTANASPGQFVMVTVPGGGFLLRRPLSLFGVHGDRAGLLVEARGAGSERLAGLEVGETVDLAGPLGSAFPTQGVTNALLVGGGIGCAPLQYLADELAAAGANVTAAFGFRDFRAARAAGAFAIERLWVASEDGAIGRHGTVMDVLAELDAPPSMVVYACGPPAMIGAVQRWSLHEGLRGYASLEAHMACGTGSCHGCVVDTTRGRLRVCSEGPVFALDEVQP